MAEVAANPTLPDKQQVVVSVTDVPEAEEPTKVVKPNPAEEGVNEGEDDSTKMTVIEGAAAAAAVTVESVLQEEKCPETETGGGDHHIFAGTEKAALDELKQILLAALNNREFSPATAASALQPPPADADDSKTETREDKETAAGNPEPAVVVTTEAEEDNKKPVETDVPNEAADHPSPQEEVKKVNIDEDGTKTVEAIEETVVSVSSSASDNTSSPPATFEEQEVKTQEAKETAESGNSTGSLPPEEVSIWGVPLLKDERTDTILWKFLLARDFRVKDAFTMMKNTIQWRINFGIDDLVEQDLNEVEGLEKAAFMHGVTKEGHPVCYNVYGAFQDKGLYQKTFSDEKKREKFLKWRIQLLEKSVRKLDFNPGGISTIVQVNDLKDSPGPGKWELRQATKQALHLLQDNYPEFVAKQVFINVPWWYMAVNKMINPFLTQRTKSKFVVAGPSKSAETLFNYITPEQVPVQYGGLSKEGEFGSKDGATHIIVKPTSKETVEFAANEACELTWEMRVLGWEVSYGAEFVPIAKDGYTVIIQKIRKIGATEETIITNTFNTSEPGKVVLTIHNSSNKKKRLLYRLKSKPSCD